MVEAAARLTGPLRGYGLDEDQTVHATRAVRTALPGFLTLETVSSAPVDSPTQPIGRCCRKVPRMPEERQDPANTQMFRAFVERGEQEPDRRGMRTAYLLIAAAVVIVIVALVVVFAH